MSDFKPDWISPPGHTIADAMEEKGITAENLRDGLKLSSLEMTYLLDGRLRIDRKLAAKLSKSLGASQQFWLNRDEQYRKAKIRLGL